MNLDGKVAVITGGASGIGKALAHKYVSLGGRVVIADLNTKDGTQVATELNAIKSNCAVFAQCDVTQRSSVENAVKTASKSFGRFDIMVNNAGIAFPMEDFVLESTEKWKKVVDINMMGVFYGTQIAIQELKKNEHGGLIINTASAAGIYPQYHAPIYAATKAAVVHLTRSLKNLQKDFNIRVVAVCPTYTVTPLITTHGPDVLKFMESQSGGLMTTDDVINVFVELTFDLKNKGGGAVFEVSPQIKDYWPRRTGTVTALTVGGNNSNKSKNVTFSNTNVSRNNTNATGDSKEIVEENGEKPLYYQREAKTTKTPSPTSTKPKTNINTSTSDNNDVPRPKEIVEVNGEKPLYYQREAAQTNTSKKSSSPKKNNLVDSPSFTEHKKPVAESKEIVEENGEKPLYYQREAALTKKSKL